MLEGVTVAPDPATDKVKFCVVVPVPLVALRMITKVPAVVGVPLIAPVPLPLLVKVIPLGRVPVSEMRGAGKPVVVTEKELAAFNAKLELLTLLDCNS